MRQRALSRAQVGLEWIALVLLIAWFVKGGLLPAWQGLLTDFPNYFVAAKLLVKGIPLERAYDWVWFQRQKDHLGIDWGIVGYVPLSPFSALLFAPLTGLAPLAAKHVWTVVNLFLLGGLAHLLGRITALPLRRIALLVFLTVVPLQTSFQFGQQHLLVAYLLALAAWMYLRQRDFPAGAILGVAAALKLYPALFGVFFLVKRRWSALAGLAASGTLLLALAVPIFGVPTLRVYATEVIPRSLAGEGNDPYYVGFNTPAVLLRRLFIGEPDLNPHPLLHSPAAYVVLQPVVASALLMSGLWFLSSRARHDDRREALEWGGFVALLLVLSSSSSTYHFCALIVATALGVDTLLATERPRVALLLVGLHLLVSLPLSRLVPREPAGWSILLGVPRLYALLAYWGVYVWALARVQPREPMSRVGAGRFALAFTALTLWSIRSNARHYEGQLSPPGARIALTQGALVVRAPSPGVSALYASRMGDEGYVLDRAGGGLVSVTRRGLDLFHPSLGSDDGRVEVAGRTSRIARFGLEVTELLPESLATVVDDAEDPQLSPDGRRVAFLRERPDGTASLWMKADDGHELRLTDDRYDVREAAFFPDGRLVVAAARGGETSLFVVSPGTGSVEPLPTADGAARYPAVSPDGRWLAYSGREGSTWQLRVQDLVSQAEQRVTHADCNAVTPTWTKDSESLVYATDCGRNLGNTALYQVRVTR